MKKLLVSLGTFAALVVIVALLQNRKGADLGESPGHAPKDGFDMDGHIEGVFENLDEKGFDMEEHNRAMRQVGPHHLEAMRSYNNLIAEQKIREAAIIESSPEYAEAARRIEELRDAVEHSENREQALELLKAAEEEWAGALAKDPEWRALQEKVEATAEEREVARQRLYTLVRTRMQAQHNLKQKESPDSRRPEVAAEAGAPASAPESESAGE